MAQAPLEYTMRRRRIPKTAVRSFIPLLGLVLFCQLPAREVTTFAPTSQGTASASEENGTRTSVSREGRPALVDPLADARQATLYVGRAVHVNGLTANGYYPTADIEFETRASAFLYAYPVRNAHRRMTVTERTDTYVKGLVWKGLWAVTCKHCVEGKRRIGVRINTVQGGTTTYLSAESNWTKHPTLDVAVAMLPLGQQTGIQYAYFDSSHAAGRQGLVLNGFREGIPVTMIGYPLGMTAGGRANYPVVRNGHIGQIQGYLDQDPRHEHFLVAGSVFPGNSGGPVVVPAGIRNANGRQLGQTVLIGMVCALEFAPAPVPGFPSGSVLQNADLTQVVPIDIVHETIENAHDWQQDGYGH